MACPQREFHIAAVIARSSPATYDAWLAVLRESQPHLEFTDPQYRNSLPMTLSFAATATRPTAMLTDPLHLIGG